MKRRLLCLLLTLVLAVSLLTLSAAAAAPYSAYIDAVKAAIEDNGTEFPGYGMLSDLDGDGTDELLMLYRAASEEHPDAKGVVLTVCTIADEKCVVLLDRRPVFFEVGGTNGMASIVEKEGRTMLVVEQSCPEDYGSSEDGERIHITGDAERYVLTDGALKSLSRLEFDYIELFPEDGEASISHDDFSCVEHTDEGDAMFSVERFESWMTKPDKYAKLDLWDFDSTSDGLPLEYLLGRLEGHIGAFTDVPADTWYSDSVEWALLHDVTKGTSDTTFSPDDTFTRAQIVTFPWREHGSPSVAGDDEIPFTDVEQDAYYYEAVRWAVTLGITAGVTETTFAPDDTVTRAQTVTFLWRDAAHPSAAVPAFTDVDADAYYASAVGWAQETGVTSGMTATTFVPDGPCTRAQIVTFLSRAMCAPGLHVSDLTGIEHDRTPDYETDEVGKEILFTAVGDVEDLAITALMLTEDGELVPDTSVTVYEAGKLSDGESFLLRTGIPDVAARFGVRYTIGDRTVTLAIQDSGLDGSLWLTEL